MNKKKSKIRESKMAIWTLVILLQMTVIYCLDVKAETVTDESGEMIIYSDVFMDEGAGEEPESIYIDQEGNSYELSSWKTIAITIPAYQKFTQKTIVYEAVEGSSRIPETIEVAVRENGQEIVTECHMKEQQIIREQWQSGFRFPITFHIYDAGFYRLADHLIPYSDEKPELNGCETLLLQLLDLSGEEYRIADVSWSGEAYVDANGEWCRDAQAEGEKIVRDIQVRYEGEIRFPKQKGWRTEAYYRICDDEAAKPPAIIESVAIIQTEESLTDIPLEDTVLPLWQKVMQTLLVTVAFGAVLFFGGLFLLLFLYLVKAIQLCYNERRKKR